MSCSADSDVTFLHVSPLQTANKGCSRVSGLQYLEDRQESDSKSSPLLTNSTHSYADVCLLQILSLGSGGLDNVHSLVSKFGYPDQVVHGCLVQLFPQKQM